MPDVTVKRVEDFEAIFGGGFRRARAGLGVSSFGLAVIDLPANFSHYPEHDQTHDDQEEVYTVLSGQATLHVGGEEYPLDSGVFARVGATERAQADHRRSARPDPRDGRDTREGLRAARVLRRGHQAALDGGDQVQEGDTRPVVSERGPARGAAGEGLAPGPSSALTRSPRPLTIAPGTRESLSRLRSAAEASSSATAITVAESSRPWPSQPPTPVRERREARAADRDVGLAHSPGTTEAVGDDHGRRGAGGLADLRSDPARRCVAVVREQRDQALIEIGGIDPGVRGDPPIPGLGDQYAGLRAHHARALREHQFDQRRILVDSVGELPGPAARFHLREPSHPPLDLGHRFLGDDDDFVIRRSLGLRDQAAEGVSFVQVGQARERPDPQLTRNQG